MCTHLCTGSSDVEPPSDCCFAPGERKTICNVTIVSDAISESAEMFTIRLNPNPAQHICDAPGGPNIKVTIVEDVEQGTVCSCLRLSIYAYHFLSVFIQYAVRSTHYTL